MVGGREGGTPDHQEKRSVMNTQEKNDTLTLNFEITQPANDTQSA